MDNLTHSLVGALIGQAGLKRKTGLAMPALILGANLPDIDATCTIYGIESLAMRRGLTHGPIAWVLLPLLLAGILHGWDRWQAQRGKRPESRLPVHFGWLFALAFIACLTHPALDWMNTYGIRLLEPFSHRWFYGDTLFIVDIWLWLGMGFATWFSLRREKRGQSWRWPAGAALAAAVLYICAGMVVGAGPSFAFAMRMKDDPDRARWLAMQQISSPVPVAPWEREFLIGGKDGWYAASYSEFGGLHALQPLAARFCRWPDTAELAKTRPDLAAFLFWSRAPFVTPAADGDGIEFDDARFYNELTRGRFAVEVKGVPCE